MLPCVAVITVPPAACDRLTMEKRPSPCAPRRAARSCLSRNRFCSWILAAALAGASELWWRRSCSSRNLELPPAGPSHCPLSLGSVGGTCRGRRGTGAGSGGGSCGRSLCFRLAWFILSVAAYLIALPILLLMRCLASLVTPTKRRSSWNSWGIIPHETIRSQVSDSSLVSGGRHGAGCCHQRRSCHGPSRSGDELMIGALRRRAVLCSALSRACCLAIGHLARDLARRRARLACRAAQPG
jgi:hypothetical protein